MNRQDVGSSQAHNTVSNTGAVCEKVELPIHSLRHRNKNTDLKRDYHPQCAKVDCTTCFTAGGENST